MIYVDSTSPSKQSSADATGAHILDIPRRIVTHLPQHGHEWPKHVGGILYEYL